MTAQGTNGKLHPLVMLASEWLFTSLHYLLPEEFPDYEVEEAEGGNVKVTWSDDGGHAILTMDPESRVGRLMVYEYEDPEDYDPFVPYQEMSEDLREIMADIDNYPHQPEDPTEVDLSDRHGFDILIDLVGTGLYGKEWRELMEDLRLDRM